MQCDRIIDLGRWNGNLHLHCNICILYLYLHFKFAYFRWPMSHRHPYFAKFTIPFFAIMQKCAKHMCVYSLLSPFGIQRSIFDFSRHSGLKAISSVECADYNVRFANFQRCIKINEMNSLTNKQRHKIFHIYDNNVDIAVNHHNRALYFWVCRGHWPRHTHTRTSRAYIISIFPIFYHNYSQTYVPNELMF